VEKIMIVSSFWVKIIMLLTGCLLATFAVPTPRLSELGSGVISSSEETIKPGGFNVERILPEIEGESVELFVKVDRKFLESELAKYLVDWIFACRDASFKKNDVTKYPVYKPMCSHIVTIEFLDKYPKLFHGLCCDRQ
jgi:hypothetical protein